MGTVRTPVLQVAPRPPPHEAGESEDEGLAVLDVEAQNRLGCRAKHHHPVDVSPWQEPDLGQAGGPSPDPFGGQLQEGRSGQHQSAHDDPTQGDEGDRDDQESFGPRRLMANRADHGEDPDGDHPEARHQEAEPLPGVGPVDDGIRIHDSPWAAAVLAPVRAAFPAAADQTKCERSPWWGHAHWHRIRFRSGGGPEMSTGYPPGVDLRTRPRALVNAEHDIPRWRLALLRIIDPVEWYMAKQGDRP